MTKDPKALITLMRNKVSSDLSLKEKMTWFHEKGVTLNKIRDDLFFLKSDRRGHVSELSEVCDEGVIYRNHKIVGFLGMKVSEMTLEEAKTARFRWDKETTYFSEYLKGNASIMFYDEKEWLFVNERGAKSSYGKLIQDKILNKMGGIDRHTYKFRVVESGKNSGIYLDAIYDNKTLKEEGRDLLWKYAVIFKVNCPKFFEFEGFEKLEESDFPLYARDKGKNRILIKSLT
jgi:hypothetical protein